MQAAETRISATLEQMPISTLIETDVRMLDQTSVDPISDEPMVDVIDDGDRLTVQRGWQIIVDARRDGKATVPARITRVDTIRRPIPRMLPLAHIIVDSRLQPRVVMHEHVIDEYAEKMREGAQFPPVEVVRDADGHYWLAAGFHRYYASERAGFDEIAAIITDGTIEDAILIAAPSNGSHGRPMNNADKERAVRMVLDHPKAIREAWSDQEIATAAGVSRPMVSKYRARMEQAGTRQHQGVRRGGDGKLYPIKAGPQHPADAPTPQEQGANGHRSDENGIVISTRELRPDETPEGADSSYDDGWRLDESAAEGAPVDLYGCDESDCGLAFAVPAWHCRTCGRHWMSTEHVVCPVCDEGLDPSVAPAPVEPVVDVVDQPVPQPVQQADQQPQAAYDPGTFKADPAVHAYRMTSTALDMLLQYSANDARAVASVPTNDVKRERLNSLSASIDWLVEIEKSWKSDLGVETVTAESTVAPEPVPTGRILVGRGMSHSTVHLIVETADMDRRLYAVCGQEVLNTNREQDDRDKICSKCSNGRGDTATEQDETE